MYEVFDFEYRYSKNQIKTLIKLFYIDISINNNKLINIRSFEFIIY